MRSNVCPHVALILAACLVALPVHAEEPAPPAVTGEAEIQLKDGSSMRGTVVSVEPGQRVIVIVAGAQSVIPWSEVAQIVGGPKETNTTPALAASSTGPAAPSPTQGMPIVHIESNWPEAELHRIDGGFGGAAYVNNHHGDHTQTRFMCLAPCDKLVDGREGNRFVISAPGMYPSNDFRLMQFDGHVTARVHGVSLARYAGGVIATATGALLTLGGGMFFGLSYVSALETPSAKNPDPQRSAEGVRTAGLAIGSVGLIGITVGVILLSAGTSRVEIIPAKDGRGGLVLDGGVLRF